MSQTLTLQTGPLSDRRQHRPSIWGLTAPQLHEAYWRSRGVQIVRRGEAGQLSSSAELFLLLEPGQMVLFDLPKLIERAGGTLNATTSELAPRAVPVTGPTM